MVEARLKAAITGMIYNKYLNLLNTKYRDQVFKYYFITDIYISI